MFLAAYLLTQYVSLGSVLAASAFAISFVLLHLDNWTVMICGAVMGIMAVVMHKGNIARLLKGEERKTNLFAKGKKS